VVNAKHFRTPRSMLHTSKRVQVLRLNIAFLSYCLRRRERCTGALQEDVQENSWLQVRNDYRATLDDLKYLINTQAQKAVVSHEQERSVNITHCNKTRTIEAVGEGQSVPTPGARGSRQFAAYVQE